MYGTPQLTGRNWAPDTQISTLRNLLGEQVSGSLNPTDGLDSCPKKFISVEIAMENWMTNGWTESSIETEWTWKLNEH